ncbi:MAG: hypothetical protein ACKVOK_00135, partial [Flavobacteriales bacterium]
MLSAKRRKIPCCVIGRERRNYAVSKTKKDPLLHHWQRPLQLSSELNEDRSLATLRDDKGAGGVGAKKGEKEKAAAPPFLSL